MSLRDPEPPYAPAWAQGPFPRAKRLLQRSSPPW